MSRDKDPESPPQIFKDTAKLLDQMETDDEQIKNLKDFLEQKEIYYDQLQQKHFDLRRSTAEKEASLDLVKERASLINSKVVYYRNKGKNICAKISDAYKDAEELETNVGKFEEQISKMSPANTSYINKIDELINLLDTLTEKRRKALTALELEEKQYEEENSELNKLIINNENFNYDEADTELQELENDIKNLQIKLCVLNEDYASIEGEEKSILTSMEELNKKYDDGIFSELENQLKETARKTEEYTENVKTRTEEEHDAVASLQTLKDYERQLDLELADANSIWESFEANQSGNVSKLNEEISKIRADILERNERYEDLQLQTTEHDKLLKKAEDELNENTVIVDKLSKELKEVENALATSEISNDLCSQREEISSQLNALRNERSSIQELIQEKQKSITKLSNRLKKEKENDDLEFLTLQNVNLSECKALEQKCTEAEASKIKIENEIKQTENKIADLTTNENTRKEILKKLTGDQSGVDNAIEEARANLKSLLAKKDEIKKKLSVVPAPPPIYMRQQELLNFARPKTPEPPKKATKKDQNFDAKRNWDSDTSLEGEEIKWRDVVNRRRKRRSDGK